MAKTTKEFLQNAAQTAAGKNPGRAEEAIPATPATVMLDVPDEGAVESAPEVDPDRPDVGQAHDPAQPGIPPWELNRAPSQAA